MRTSKREMGETLLETLISATIVIVLMAILIPVFVKARGRARQTTCASNLKQLHLAFAMYAGDHDGALPPYTNNLIFAQDNQSETAKHKEHYPPNGALFVASLRPYTHAKSIWFCPDDSLAHQNTLAISYPAGLQIDHRYSSYEAAWWMGLIKYPAKIDGVTMGDIHGKTVTMNAANEVMLADEQIQKTGCGDWLYSHSNRFNQLFLDGHVKSIAVQCAE